MGGDPPIEKWGLYTSGNIGVKLKLSFETTTVSERSTAIAVGSCNVAYEPNVEAIRGSGETHEAEPLYKDSRRTKMSTRLTA